MSDTPDPGATRTPFHGGGTSSTPGGSGTSGRFLPGTVLAGRYRIVGLLGKGGMGEVYRADDLKLGQAVALKFLPESLELEDAHLARLLQEVRLARQVSHPNVCRVYDVVEVEGRHFLSMEYVDGEDLASLLRRIGRLPHDKALELARQLCAGIAAAHARGIVHRDLKPSNVMVDGRGAVRITDFGLAQTAEMVLGGALREGTPLYMAPEQLAGRQASVQSDVYSLGLVLYELFTGKHAFPGAGSGRFEPDATPTRPSSWIADLDPAVERTLLHCLEPDPAARPRTALAVAAALPGADLLAAALAAGETPSPEMVAAAGDAEAANPSAAALVAVLAVVLFCLAAWLNGRNALRAWVPLGKTPEVLVDQAREIVRELGYDEPAYADPGDTAHGYDVWDSQIAWIEANDSGPDRWERLASPEAGVLTFWYRQSPVLLGPQPTGQTFASGRVDRWNPFPSATGSILVTLDPAGKLRFFACAPRRYSAVPPAPGGGDASRAFELAGLDIKAFTPVEPRYQRFMLPDQRSAWVGALPQRPDQPVRIEAGWFEGRLVLFAILEPWEIENLASEPDRSRDPSPGERAFIWTELAVLLAGAAFARRNVRSGRADRRGATRAAVGVFVATLLFEVLRSHTLWAAQLEEAFPIAATALFYAAVAMTLYLALEPYARRVWPSILVSWSRLTGRARLGFRDPLVGRSVLAGLLGGALLPLLWPVARRVQSALLGAPAPPVAGDWTILLGQRQALAEILGAAVWGVMQGFILAFMLVAGRLVLRSRALAVAAAVLLWIVLAEVDTSSLQRALVDVSQAALGVALLIAVLLRWGLVAAVVLRIGANLAELAPAADWSAWHSQPALLAIAAFAALAAYGYWAACPNRDRSIFLNGSASQVLETRLGVRRAARPPLETDGLR